MATLGIDLGTTNSLIAEFKNGKPTLIPNAHGEALTPSIVGVLQDGRVLVGKAARELRITHPDWVAGGFKRWMGTDKRILLNGQVFTAPELSALVLRSLKADAEHWLGAPVSEVVITVPAYFNELQRQATQLAAELAGLKAIRIINEPTAAALAYGFHSRAEDAMHLLVFDLGGGTFDVTLMERFDNALQILTTAGESFLGGEDFTEALASHVLHAQGLDTAHVQSAAPLRWARLLHECEQAKRALSNAATTTLRLPDDKGNVDADRVAEVTREQLLAACEPLMLRLAGPTARVLRDAELRPDDITDVVLVGGATRASIVQDWVAKLFQRTPLCTHNPDHVVALGAAVQAALIADDAAVADMVMTDVCPFTLGVEVSRQLGNRREAGFFSPIIHRNTTIPVSREDDFSTVEPLQTEIHLRIFQGDARRTEHNLQIGELLVKDLPRQHDPVQVTVRFSYDLNGLLEVEAIVPATGRRCSTVITRNCGNLSPDEVKRALERLAAIKFFPREQAVNRHLLHYAERVIPELPNFMREELDVLLVQFETAMNLAEKQPFEEARERLVAYLAQIGFPFDEANTDDHGDR